MDDVVVTFVKKIDTKKTVPKKRTVKIAPSKQRKTKGHKTKSKR